MRTRASLLSVLQVAFLTVVTAALDNATDTVANDDIEVPVYSIVLTPDNPEDYIISPGFPYEPYPSDTQVEYNVTVALPDDVSQLSTRILITFEMFALEKSIFCHKDGLEVVEPSGQIRVFCGVQAGRTLLSEESSLSFRFFSDSDVQARGFSVRVQMYQSRCSANIFGDTTGIIESPNFPSEYRSDDVCVWKITAPPGKKVRVKFEEPFAIQGDPPLCLQDYLAVSVTGSFLTDVKRFCGDSRPALIDSASTSLLLMFHTDCCWEGKGFRATFAVMDDVVTTTTPPPPPLTSCLCGQENLEQRIVGGDEVLPAHRYPWMVGVVNDKGRVDCGAALINRQYILTAAHCVERKTPSTMKVLLGGHHLPTSPTPVAVSEVRLHPGYHNRSYVNDIAVVKLQSPVDTTTEVAPICIPPPEFPTDRTLGVVAGWGRTFEAGPESQTLRQLTVMAISNALCVQKYGGIILDTNLCAGGEKNKDSCQGDSGGPLMMKREDSWFISGVVSWGIGCGREGYSGVYTRVSAYRSWIEANTADAPPCDDVLPPTLPPPLRPNPDDCGIPNEDLTDRIVGGDETQPFQYPWIALIVHDRGVIGAGTLLGRHFVLTAASILKDWFVWYPDVVEVYLGQHDITKKEPFTTKYKVTRILVHDQFGKPSPYNNDLAILVLDVPKEGVADIYRPVCVPQSVASLPAGSFLVVAGWGRTSTNSIGSTVLRHVTLQVANQEKCSATYAGWVTDTMICAEGRNKDTCTGDEGAPLMLLYKGRHYLIGVTSWGSVEGCAIPGKPRVFSAVHKNLQWISGATGLPVV